MRVGNPFALVPSQPDVQSWFASVVLGLIGVYLFSATATANFGPIVGALLPLGALVAVIGFLEAYAHARSLDAEEQR